jgi:branched-chain amino acid transport system ATP-binding protein
MLLEVESLRVHWGKAEALKGITLHVDEGEVVSIVGANGAGKTTLMRTISGLKKPTSGEIKFHGKSIGSMVAHNIAKLGIAHIPAGRMVFAPMTVLDNLKVGAYLCKDKPEMCRNLDIMYRHFPVLEERTGQMAGSLSGGEQQMLAVARALMSSPRLLLMDEPSIGLSPILVAEVGKIIKKISEEGINILLVEQNARMALKLAKRAYVIELGKIVLEGNAAELINNESVKKAYLGGGTEQK